MTYKSHTVLIVGATRGTGAALVKEMLAANHRVIAVGRTQASVEASELAEPKAIWISADSSHEGVAEQLLGQYEPDVVVLVGGAQPTVAPFQNMSWLQFSQTWENDTKMSFEWSKALLHAATDKPRLLISFSSGASLNGSPLSGGYAGAKRMQTFLAGYAQREANLMQRNLRFLSVIPTQLIEGTAIASQASQAYAQASGKTADQFMSQWPQPLTPERCAQAVVELIQEQPKEGVVFTISGSGLAQVA
ncbi:MAG: SDR family oxidoreductase [Reinekea sp.]|nr:SDR family oxidoreductase [Reinekea sp.]